MKHLIAMLILLGWPSLYFIRGGLRLVVRAGIILGLTLMAILIVGSMTWAAATLSTLLG